MTSSSLILEPFDLLLVIAHPLRRSSPNAKAKLFCNVTKFMGRWGGAMRV